jgi:hypothetical protein
MSRATQERFQKYAQIVRVQQIASGLNVAHAFGYDLTARRLGALLIRAMARAGL